MNAQRIATLITLSGAAGFVAIAGYLQVVQAGYDPVHQFMSELALGAHGHLMLYAFMLLALSVAGCAGLLAWGRASFALAVLLAAAALCLAGAGIFSLAVAVVVHIVLVALAFVLLVLAMLLAPRQVQTVQARLVCWGLGAGTTLFAELGNTVLPGGIAQRLAAGCILAWMCWLALYVPRTAVRERVR